MLFTTYQHERIYKKRGFLGHILCVRCGAEESLEHIFFHCEPAKEVWELCPLTILIDHLACSSFRITLQDSLTKVNLPIIGTSSNIFAWICWSLWINRNQFTVENKQTPRWKSFLNQSHYWRNGNKPKPRSVNQRTTHLCKSRSRS